MMLGRYFELSILFDFNIREKFFSNTEYRPYIKQTKLNNMSYKQKHATKY